MQIILVRKGIVFAVIFLFIGVGIHHAFAVDAKQSMVNKASIEDCGCGDVSLTDLVKIEKLLDRVEVYSKLLLVLARYNPELKEISEELLDLINFDWPFPIICVSLFILTINILILAEGLLKIMWEFPMDSILFKMLWNLCMLLDNIFCQLVEIAIDLDCYWLPGPYPDSL